MSSKDNASGPDIGRLFDIMARLRTPGTGCEWDLAQDFDSIAPYTLEEAYEVADAIARKDYGELRDELGDLLLQVVFHARMAEELGAFDLQDVIDSISDKMERRHPHIFTDGAIADAEAVERNWETIKERERASKGETSTLDGVALALPALLRAQKLQKRAARVGFDWPDEQGPRDKVIEELEEVRSASSPEEREEEVGDLLFSAVNLARHNGVDAEAALRNANAKFERRFKKMEKLNEKPFDDLSLDELEVLWVRAKQSD